MQTFITPYKPAQLYTGKNYWYIYYYFLHPVTGKYQRFKEYFDINRIPNKKERRLYGQEVVRFINQKLALGFNPFKQATELEEGNTIIAALDLLYADLMKHANNTMKLYYASQLNRFKKFLTEKNLVAISVTQVSIQLAESFKSWMQDKQLAKKTINVNLSHMRIFWERAIKQNLAAANPFAKVEPVKQQVRHAEDAVEDMYEPITFEELQLIVAAVKKSTEPNFLVVIMLIYYAWIRPGEVRKLRVGDIDMVNKTIKLKKGNTKSNKGAFVQIVPALVPYLESMELHKYPKDYFLFCEGSPLRDSRGNTSFVPGMKQVHKIKFNRTWAKVVKDGLGIDKNLYALKHTGNIEYLQSNKGSIDLKWQQMQNRHSSAAMTEKYIRQLGAYFIEVANVKFREL